MLDRTLTTPIRMILTLNVLLQYCHCKYVRTWKRRIYAIRYSKLYLSFS